MRQQLLVEVLVHAALRLNQADASKIEALQQGHNYAAQEEVDGWSIRVVAVQQKEIQDVVCAVPEKPGK